MRLSVPQDPLLNTEAWNCNATSELKVVGNLWYEYGIAAHAIA